LLHVSITSNSYQADISVHGHDMFSGTQYNPEHNYLVKFSVMY